MTWLCSRFIVRNQIRLTCALLAMTVLCATRAVAEEATTVSFSSADFFDRQVQPILARNCFKCHGGEEKIRGGLRLTRRQDILAGGDSGPAFDREDPDASVLLEAINYEGLEMPPQGMLPAEQRAILANWVKLGIPWSKTTEDFGFNSESEEREGPPEVNEESRAFWSFQPVGRPTVPKVHNAAWVQIPLDAFVLRKLEDNGLTPNQRAGKVRRTP